MKSLLIVYSILGFTTGFIILLLFLSSLPDGKLHVVFCNVGQGDAIYVRLPDGRDVLIDGGPNTAVVGCLSRAMAFWDRSLDIVLLTHPERDHMQGLAAVVSRYKVGALVMPQAPVVNEQQQHFLMLVEKQHIPVKRVAAGTVLTAGSVAFTVVWPSPEYLARLPGFDDVETGTVLGAQTPPNTLSLVLHLKYGNFDVLLTGDADTPHAQTATRDAIADASLEVLKLPHHGSAQGISKDYLDALHPQIAVISVGRNTYGHPSPVVLGMLAENHVRVLRTDEEGDIEVVSDGNSWNLTRAASSRK